jgi:hypothetical protein
MREIKFRAWDGNNKRMSFFATLDFRYEYREMTFSVIPHEGQTGLRSIRGD